MHTSVCHYDLYAIEDCVSGLTRIAASSPEALTRVGKRRSITMICSVRCRRSRTTNTKEGNWTRYSFNTIILCIVKLRRKVVVHWSQGSPQISSVTSLKVFVRTLFWHHHYLLWRHLKFSWGLYFDIITTFCDFISCYCDVVTSSCDIITSLCA